MMRDIVRWNAVMADSLDGKLDGEETTVLLQRGGNHLGVHSRGQLISTAVFFLVFLVTGLHKLLGLDLDLVSIRLDDDGLVSELCDVDIEFDLLVRIINALLDLLFVQPDELAASGTGWQKHPHLLLHPAHLLVHLQFHPLDLGIDIQTGSGGTGAGDHLGRGHALSAGLDG